MDSWLRELADKRLKAIASLNEIMAKRRKRFTAFALLLVGQNQQDSVFTPLNIIHDW